MKTQCPHCKTKFSVSDSNLNKQAKCSNCKHSFTITPIQEPTNTEKTNSESSELGSASNPIHTTVTEIRKSVSGLGIASLVLGIIACMSCWIPFIGCLVVPIGVIGLLFGIIGLLISLFGRRSGCGIPFSGAVVSLVSIIIAISVTGATTSAIEQVNKEAVSIQNKQVEPSPSQKRNMANNNTVDIKKSNDAKKIVQNYADNIQIYDLIAKYYESFSGKTPGVQFKIRNLGDKTVTKLKVAVFFKDMNNMTISEEEFMPINTESFSDDFRKPLKSGYIWSMPDSKFFPAESVPSEWQEGNISISVTDIKLLDQ